MTNKTLATLLAEGRRVAGLDMSTTSSVGVTYHATTGFSDPTTPVPTPLVEGLAEGRSELEGTAVPNWLSDVLKLLGPEGLGAVASSVMQHGLVCLDEDMQIVGNVLLWNDQRAVRATQWLNQDDLAMNHTGNRAELGFILPKLLHLKRHAHAKYRRIKHVTTLADYVGYLLTGKLVLSKSDGACNNLLTPQGELATELLEKCKIDPALFPEIVEAGACLGTASTDLAREIGLPEDCLVFAGLADNHASATGAGLPSDALLLSFGTSGTAVRSSSEVRKGPWHIFADFNAQILFLSILMRCGDAWEAWKHSRADQISEEMNQDGKTTDVDEFLDEQALSGKAANYLDEKATERHQRSRFSGEVINGASNGPLGNQARSVLESLVFGLWARAEGMLDDTITTIYLAGGVSQSSVVSSSVRVLAENRGLEVRIPQTAQTAAVGPIIGALATGGVYSSLDAAKAELTSSEPISDAFTPGGIISRFEQWKQWRGEVS